MLKISHLQQLLMLLVSFCLFSPVQADTIYRAATLINELGIGENGLLLPSDVAVYKGRAYVVDGSHHRIAVYDSAGKLRFSFAKEGKKDGQLSYPVGIDVATNGDVYVADSGNRRIQVFSAAGKFKRSFKIKQDKYLLRPVDVLVDEKQKELYVTVNETHSVKVYSLSGKLKREWGDNGVSTGQFRYPATLARLKDKRVAVVDVLNSRLQVFEPDGTFTKSISGWGVTQGQVFRPKGVAVDNKGRVYLTDSYMNVVQVFADDGSFQHVIKTDRALRTPVGIALDGDRLYVTEMRENRVSVFRLAP